MRFFVGVLLGLGLLTLPALAGDGFDCPYSKKIERSRCAQHMCPMAQSSTQEGYVVVAQLPVSVVSLSEFEV